VEGGYKLWGVPYKVSEKHMASMIYIFFVSKIYEFMDTFIMLLKGNVKQARRQLRLCAVCAHARIAGDSAARVPPREHQLHLVDDHVHGAGRRRLLLGRAEQLCGAMASHGCHRGPAQAARFSTSSCTPTTCSLF